MDYGARPRAMSNHSHGGNPLGKTLRLCMIGTVAKLRVMCATTLRDDARSAVYKRRPIFEAANPKQEGGRIRVMRPFAIAT